MGSKPGGTTPKGGMTTFQGGRENVENLISHIFLGLNELVNGTENHILNIENEFKEMILAHLVSLKDHLSKYFPDNSTENWQF